MISVAERFESVKASFIQAVQKFARSLGEIGPHPIPKHRRVANEYHRIHSIKGGQTCVECESSLETLATIWGESRPEIVGLMTQPLRIHGAIGKRPYHTLDLCFDYEDGRKVYYEVKPSKHLKTHEDGTIGPANWPFIKAWGEANGVEVDFITEKDLLPHRQRIENWRTLMPFAAISYERPDPDLEVAIFQLVKIGRAWTFAQLHDCHPTIDSEEVTAHVAKLVHKGKISADLNAGPVSPATELWVEEKSDA